MVASQASQLVHLALIQTELQLGRHLILQKRNEADINIPFLADYIRSGCITHVAMLHAQAEFAEEESVTLMENSL
jgi:hypothetical protein